MTLQDLPDYGLAVVISDNVRNPAGQLICFREGELLSTLYWAIGCELVDLVRLAGDRLTEKVAPGGELSLWVDDEGMFRVAGPNRRYHSVALEFGLQQRLLFGPVVITGGADEDGDTLGLTPDQALHLMAILNVDDSAED